MPLLPEDGTDNALSWVVESARDEFNAERVEIWLWDADAAVLRLAAALAADETRDFHGHAATEAIRTGEGLLGKIVEERVALIDFQPVRIEQGVFPARTSDDGEGIEVYFAGYPLNFRDDFIGVMACYTREPVKRDMHSSWWVLGNAAAIALHDLLLLRQRDQTVAALSTLLWSPLTGIAPAQQEQELGAVAGKLAALARQELGCEKAVVALVDGSRKQLIACDGETIERRAIDGELEAALRPPVKPAAQSSAPQGGESCAAIGDAAGRPGSAQLSLPVRNSAGHLIAMFEAVEPRGFSARHQQAARAWASMIGVALESALAA